MEFEKKPFKVKDVTRNIKKAVVVGSLEEIRYKVAEKFNRNNELPTIHLDSDGTEIDDEEYFRTLDPNTELIAVFPGEHWIDPSHYVTLSNYPEDQLDASDKAAKTARIKQLMGQLQNNLCNVSVLSDPDLETLSNMDPNSLVDITGKDFMEQLKDLGRPLCTKRNAQDRINLLKLLKDGAIFCSERYPEDAEAIDVEIRRQIKDDAIATAAATTTTANISTAGEIIQTYYNNTNANKKASDLIEFNNSSTIGTIGSKATAKTIDHHHQQQQQHHQQQHHHHQLHRQHHYQQEQQQRQQQQDVTIVVDTSEMTAKTMSTATTATATVAATATATVSTSTALSSSSSSVREKVTKPVGTLAPVATTITTTTTTITTTATTISTNRGNSEVHDI